MCLINAFPDIELMCAESTDGASCAWLASFGVFNGPRVIPCPLHAFFVVGKTAECAKDHLIWVLEYIAARGTFLDTLVMI